MQKNSSSFPQLFASNQDSSSTARDDNGVADTIYFYKQSEVPYGVFSNFPFFKIVIDGEEWNSSEIYFQAKKFEGTEHEAFLKAAETSKEAAQLGRDRSRPLRADWNASMDFSKLHNSSEAYYLSSLWNKYVGRPMLVKDYYMLIAVLAKFTQHPELGTLLIDTGKALIVEHTEKDNYWADGGDGTGENILGRILMIAREVLSN
ncbi:MAG: NADAR family protein [Candidatus Obscuribacter sp.]|jgi:predicted NAD-dependent protein-ADP-ribosyltransferase YbiA (DUF1768 family)|nr:NADAR family protein [Candidatus Obscuribacter sp.]